MKNVLFISALAVLAGCCKPEQEQIIHELKCDTTADVPDYLISNTFARGEFIGIRKVKPEMCKACDCKTGRIFILKSHQ